MPQREFEELQGVRGCGHRTLLLILLGNSAFRRDEWNVLWSFFQGRVFTARTLPSDLICCQLLLPFLNSRWPHPFIFKERKALLTAYWTVQLKPDRDRLDGEFSKHTICYNAISCQRSRCSCLGIPWRRQAARGSWVYFTLMIRFFSSGGRSLPPFSA